MSTEERLTNIEGILGRVAGTMESMAVIAGRQDARLESMEDVLRGHQERLDRMENILRGHQERLDLQGALLEEMRRDNAYTRKLWVLAARKMGLLDDLPDEDV